MRSSLVVKIFFRVGQVIITTRLAFDCKNVSAWWGLRMQVTRLLAEHLNCVLRSDDHGGCVGGEVEEESAASLASEAHQHHYRPHPLLDGLLLSVHQWKSD